MRLKSFILTAAAPLAMLASATPAAAQGIPVYDVSNYLQALSTVQNTLQMIQQGEQQIQTASNQLASLQKLTNVNSLATTLINSTVRNILPDTNINATTLLSGNTNALGALGTLAKQLQGNYSISSSSSSSADAAYTQALQNATGLAATKAALGQNTLGITQTRMQGLEQLRQALDSAQDPKDVMDLNARIASEQAQLQNDMLKLKAIELSEQGQAALSHASAHAAAARDQAALFTANTLRTSQ